MGAFGFFPSEITDDNQQWGWRMMDGCIESKVSTVDVQVIGCSWKQLASGPSAGLQWTLNGMAEGVRCWNVTGTSLSQVMDAKGR